MSAASCRSRIRTLIDDEALVDDLLGIGVGELRASARLTVNGDRAATTLFATYPTPGG